MHAGCYLRRVGGLDQPTWDQECLFELCSIPVGRARKDLRGRKAADLNRSPKAKDLSQIPKICESAQVLLRFRIGMLWRIGRRPPQALWNAQKPEPQAGDPPF